MLSFLFVFEDFVCLLLLPPFHSFFSLSFSPVCSLRARACVCVRVPAGNYKGLARDLFPNADRFLSILGSVASLFNASGRVIGGLSIDR